MAEEPKQTIDWNAFEKLDQEAAAAAAVLKKDCSAFWDKLSYDEKLMAFYSVVSRIVQGELNDKRSYRGILYENFGFDVDSYAVGIECGFMRLHNAIEEDVRPWVKAHKLKKEENNGQ